MVMHRAIKGTPKTAVVKRTPTGKWFVSIGVEMEKEQAASRQLPVSEEVVGIDVGLKSFAYLSTGEEIANPRFFRTEEAALARAQRKLSQASAGSQQARQAVWLYCRGSVDGAQSDQEPEIGEINRQCLVVDVLHANARQSGGSWVASACE
jgi:hypothetical protein